MKKQLLPIGTPVFDLFNGGSYKHFSREIPEFFKNK